MTVKITHLFIILFLFSLITLGQELQVGLPIGHSSMINSSKFSADGKYIVTTSFDETARVWETSSSKLLHTFVGHSANLLDAEFSHNGKMVVTASSDNTAKVWETATGKLLLTLKGHSKTVRSATFNPDDSNIVTISADNTIKVWKTDNGKLLRTLKEHTDWVLSVEFSPDGKSILTSSRDSTAIIWDARSKRLLKRLKGHTNIVTSAKFSPNGKQIMTSSYDSTSRLWETSTGRLINELKGHRRKIEASLISPNGKTAVTVSGDQTAIIWDLKSARILQVLKGHTGSIISLDISKDGRNIATGSEDGTARIWEADTGILKKTLDNGSFVNSINFSSNGQNIMTSSQSDSTLLWDVLSGRLLHKFEGVVLRVNSAKVSADGNKLLISSYGNKLLIREISTGKKVQTLQSNKGSFRNLEISPSGNYALTSYLGIAELWDIISGKLLHQFEGHKVNDYTYEIKSIAINPNEESILIASNNRASLYDIISGKLLKTYVGGTKDIKTISFSPDGKTIAMSSDRDLQLFKTVYGRPLIKGVLKHSSGDVQDVQFSPDGQKVATSTYDKGYIWDATSFELLTILDGHQGFVNSIHFSPDGQNIVTSSDDKTASIWSVASGKLIHTLNGHDDLVNSALYNPNGNFIVTASDDGSIIHWDSKTGKQLIRQFIFDDEDYILFLPDGYYSGSKNAVTNLYYKKELQTLGFEQLDIKYNRPDKVLEVLGTINNTPDTIMIRAYKKAWQKRVKKLKIDTTSFTEIFSLPQSKITNRESIAFDQNKSELELSLKSSDSLYALDRINVWVNEVPLYGKNGISLKERVSNTIDTTVTLELSNGINKIEASVFNMNGTESYRRPLYINFQTKELTKEKLYFVGIGIDNYKEKGHDLNYSVKDIRDLSKQLKVRYNQNIAIDTLFDKNVTVENILKLKDKLQKTKVDDKVIISFSGHGLLSNDLDYYLGTYDVNFSDPEKNGLPYEDLEFLLDGIPSRKKLLLIDACHSGEVDKDEVEAIAKVENLKPGLKGSIGVRNKNVKMGMKNSFELMKELFNNVDRATGATVISAAAGTQFAQERGELKNGVFTYCILNQLKRKESISVSELKRLVSKQVVALTNGLQQPTSRNQTIENDWKVW
ncbi:WD40 repeat [Nonlabens sp. Hel1_33_55]|uniref:caspase family protein n=1 Tax=Nonlabens sp. Hel1_33_55 TaxID=1336802 RepID=UPI000875B25F|nr:caspase family protein [Nonlabens sp. Hel1_33_55]SCX99462.1 WD40 repeat [Nonlabens sp. Hel1_33_55]